MRHNYWIKFLGERPTRWTADTWDELWHNIREHIIQHQVLLEWMVRE